MTHYLPHYASIIAAIYRPVNEDAETTCTNRKSPPGACLPPAGWSSPRVPPPGVGTANQATTGFFPPSGGGQDGWVNFAGAFVNNPGYGKRVNNSLSEGWDGFLLQWSRQGNIWLWYLKYDSLVHAEKGRSRVISVLDLFCYNQSINLSPTEVPHAQALL